MNERLLETIILCAVAMLIISIPSISIQWNEGYDRLPRHTSNGIADIKKGSLVGHVPTVSDKTRSDDDTCPNSQLEPQAKATMGLTNKQLARKPLQIYNQERKNGCVSQPSKIFSDEVMQTRNQSMPVRLDGVVPSAEFNSTEMP
jgi:hypothetical protein